MSEEKFVPDFETNINLMSKDEMAAQYLKIRMEHMKNVELEKAEKAKEEAKKNEIASATAEVHKYFGLK